MKVIEPKIGQRVYTSKNCQIGRWIVEEIITREVKNGKVVEYVLMDDIGRKIKIGVGDRVLFDNLAEAIALGLQQLQIIEKTTREELEAMTDKVIDKRVKEHQQKLKENKKK